MPKDDSIHITLVITTSHAFKKTTGELYALLVCEELTS